MKERGVEAGDVSVDVTSGIEHGADVVEVGSEGDGNDDLLNDEVVTSGEDESDNSYLLVSRGDVLLEDTAKRGNGSEVLVDLSYPEALVKSGSKVNETESLAEAEAEIEGVVESLLGDSSQNEMSTDMVGEIKIVDVEAERGKVENTLKVYKPIKAAYSKKLEDVQVVVHVATRDHESYSKLIINGVVGNGDLDLEVTIPSVEEKLVAKVETTELNESDHTVELEKEGSEKISLDKKESQESEDLLSSDALANSIEAEQAEHINVTDQLSNKEVIIDKQSQLGKDESKLENTSEVPSDVKQNKNCESLVPVDVLNVNSEEQPDSAHIFPVESNAEFSYEAIPNEHDGVQSRNIVCTNVNESENEKSEAVSSISTEVLLYLTEHKDRIFDHERVLEVYDDQTPKAEQTMSKDMPLNSVDHEQKMLASDIIGGLQSDLGTKCANGDGNAHVWMDDVEVVEPGTYTGHSGLHNNEGSELSYFITQKKTSTESKNDAQGIHVSVDRVYEEMRLADRDREEVVKVITVDDNRVGNKKEFIDVSLSEDSENACIDTETSEEINHTGRIKTSAGDTDQVNGISSPAILITYSHSISDEIACASNLEKKVDLLHSGIKDYKTNLNGNVDAPKVETSSSSHDEESSLDAAESEAVIRPFLFYIKVPRLEDNDIMEQIKFAQQGVDEKTKLRDSYNLPIQIKRDECIKLNDDFIAAKLVEKAARDKLKAKRKEIDVAQAVIDKVNNAMTVEDIDGSIHIMEDRMQHETVHLSEEKQLMREIKRLKHFREQLSSSIGTPEELQEAFNQKDRIKHLLKSLRRELNVIRSEVQRAETVATAAKKKQFDKFVELNKLQLEFRTANDLRQEAYMSLASLRRELTQKFLIAQNRLFSMYTDAEKIANNYALSGDKKALQSLCVNQVEMFMELWNTNDEFRTDYVKRNAKSTLRRLKTFDGRSVGLDEEPPSLSYIRNDRISHSEVVTKSLPHFCLEEESDVHIPSTTEPTVNEHAVALLEKHEAKKRSKSTTLVSEVSTVPSQELTREEIEVIKKREEEEELAKKAEEIRKKEEEDKMMEKLLLEEKAKAKEALERKRRMEEKAQARARIRAKKEAEQREKEREKRQRKKEKRKDGKEDANEKDFLAENKAREELAKETKLTEKHATVSKRHYKASHYAKTTKTSTMPINLRNRSRRKMQMWMWSGLAALAAVAMVLLWFGLLAPLG